MNRNQLNKLMMWYPKIKQLIQIKFLIELHQIRINKKIIEFKTSQMLTISTI